MVVDIFRDTSQTITAHFSLATIQIEHLHPSVSDFARANADHAISPNAKLSVGNRNRQIGDVFGYFLSKAIDINIVIASAVHFREFHAAHRTDQTTFCEPICKRQTQQVKVSSWDRTVIDPGRDLFGCDYLL